MLLEKAYFVEETIFFKGGRQTLIKSTLSRLPIYFMSLLFAISSSHESGKVSEIFFLGKKVRMGWGGGFDSQAASGELVCLLHGKIKKGIWALKTYPFLIRLCWENGLGVL